MIVSGLAISLGFFSNLSRLWPTYEYSKETIRGKSELTQKEGKGDGLDKDYLFGWSYGIDESLTLLVPHYAGGGAGESYKNTQLYNAVAPQVRNQITSLFYSGEQPFVGTAIYFGAIVIFLFLMGAWLVSGPPKYWFLAGGLFMLSLAWGKHFFLNDLFYDYLPMFNKFRAVSMALGVSQLCFAVLAALGLQKITDPDISIDRKKRALWWSAGISAGLCLLAIAISSTSGQHDNLLQQDPNLLRLIQEDRADLVRSDAFRSIGLIAVGAALVWLYLQAKLSAGIAVVLLALLGLGDNWMVCSRTLNNQKYETKRAALAPPPEAPYDKQIKQDPDPHYRVLDLSRGNITSNWITSYFHKSLGGYHAAKLQRYQEVVDTFLNNDLGRNLHIVGMFNGKYVVSPQGDLFPNPKACGHAWFVQSYFVVPTADAELHALGSLNPKDTAVVQQGYADALEGLTIQADSTAQIRLVSYHPDTMRYEYSAATEQLAVFPEIYYPPAKGWKCYLNGQEAPDFIKVDYLLRGMRLPPGQNIQLEMRFEPRSFYLGEQVARVASALILLLLLGGLFWWFRSHELEDPNRLADSTAPEKPAHSRSTTPTSDTGSAKPRKRKK